MKETLICSLEKHNIYYLSDANVSFYILVPYKEYDNTNISIRLKSNYDSYDLTKNSLEVVTNELINYYKNLDNYNITLILPVFYNNILDRIRVVEDLEMYQMVDRYLGVIFNNAYIFLTKNNVKVNNSIYVINNDSFKKFTNWFVSRYNNRIEYKTILDLVKDNAKEGTVGSVVNGTIARAEADGVIAPQKDLTDFSIYNTDDAALWNAYAAAGATAAVMVNIGAARAAQGIPSTLLYFNDNIEFATGLPSIDYGRAEGVAVGFSFFSHSIYGGGGPGLFNGNHVVTRHSKGFCIPCVAAAMSLDAGTQLFSPEATSGLIKEVYSQVDEFREPLKYVALAADDIKGDI